MRQGEPREGMVDVPGARLRYRWAGSPGAPLLVFENGWGASYEQWAWVERELAPHAQLLFYDRAGLGGSQRLVPQTVAGLSAQFAALLAALSLPRQVVAVGHSYGGLVCALHAAQCPEHLHAVIEVDPTPERDDIDASTGLRALPGLIGAVKFALRLGLPNLMFGSVRKMLPPDEGRTLMRLAMNNPASLDGGLDEFALLPEIRATIAARRPRGIPRLLISAGSIAPPTGLIGRLLVPESRARAVLAQNQAFQRSRKPEDPGLRIVSLPYDHGALVFTQEGARATAAAVRHFVQSGMRATP